MKRLISILLFIIACLIFIYLSSCKTRKVNTEQSKVSKELVISKETGTHSTDIARKVDLSTEKKRTTVEAKNSQHDSTEFEADSIVQTRDKKGTVKTKIYPKGKIKQISNYASDQHIEDLVSKQYNTQETQTKSLDSFSKYNEHSKQDSTGKHKNTDAKGSGSILAYVIPVCVLAFLCIVAFLAYRYFKK